MRRVKTAVAVRPLEEAVTMCHALSIGLHSILSRGGKGMTAVLDKVDVPADVKRLSDQELSGLAEDIRALIVDTVSRTGGHLAPNLGVVELTIALMKVFNPPDDKILWDVGHQSYAYKILTGRKGRFGTLRQHGGLSGFQSRAESPFDAFGAGHSGTALSAALGMAVARDRRGSGEHVVAVVGDGSFGCGISFEAMNNIASTAKRLIVILNDNEMSISANVGGLSRHLGELLANPRYNRWKSTIESAVSRVSGRSNLLRRAYYRLEEAIKGIFLHSVIFEELGLRYIGPIDGHDILRLTAALEIARDYDRPILLHVSTQKGRGYAYAEDCPEAWHGIGSFNIETGMVQATAAGPTYSQVFGAAMETLGARDERLVAITAAMQTGTGLSAFAERFPDRFFDVGICEEHAAIFSAGLATQGLRPVFAVYSTFSQRAVDCIIHDVCLQKLPVIFCLDRAGIVGDDGPTHHGIFDLALLRSIPNLTLMQPANGVELVHMLYSATKWNGPVVIRYPRGVSPGFVMPDHFEELTPGQARVLREGWEVQLWALGDMIPAAIQAADILAARGYSVGVVNGRFVDPIDRALLKSQARLAKAFITVENGMASGGFGSVIEECLVEMQYPGRILRLGWPREFVPHGASALLMEKYGLTPGAIADRVTSLLNR
jgi:1-deoxy-D-xylulose-5-phosphate synthase